MSALTTAWQAALAAEHRAVFGYGLLGPKLRGAESALAVGCSNAHEQLRDRTAAAVSAAGLTPVTPRADYPDLYPVDDAADARALAVRIEDDCAAAWRFLYLRAASTHEDGAAELRVASQAALTASAVRASGWRRRIDPAHVTVAFPGIG
jgi:Domain of unknown function (DUF4439)